MEIVQVDGLKVCVCLPELRPDTKTILKELLVPALTVELCATAEAVLPRKQFTA